ncbi:MAG: Crp/Fnr family transcriptional regulator [Oxalobacteraceae bacterium]
MRNDLIPAKISSYRRSVSRGRYQQHFEASRTRPFHQGEQIYSADTAGICWRVVSGSVRLNRIDNDGEMLFANLAVKDDVIGTETLLMGHYTFSAVALSDCELAPWPEGLSSASKDALLHILAAAERRTADVVALRSGLAIDRVMRLIAMLAQRDENHELCFALPKGQDISEITDLRKETISRTVSSLKQEGMIRKMKIPGHAIDRNYIFYGSTAWSADDGSNRVAQSR